MNDYYYITPKQRQNLQVKLPDYESFDLIDEKEGINGEFITKFPEMITDFYVEGDLLVSEEFFDIVSLYQKNIRKRFVYMAEKRNKLHLVYWMISLPIFERDKWLAMATDRRRQTNFFKIVEEDRYVISEAAVEALLQEGKRGFDLERVDEEIFNIKEHN